MPGHYLSCFLPGNKAWVRLKYGLSFNIQTTYKPQPFIDPSESNEPEHSTDRLLNTDAKYRGPESILETTQKEHVGVAAKTSFLHEAGVKRCCPFNFHQSTTDN